MKLAMMAGLGSGPESIDKWKAGLCLKYHAETDALTTESKYSSRSHRGHDFGHESSRNNRTKVCMCILCIYNNYL